MEQILLGLLGKTLNMTEEQIKSLLYKEDGEENELKDDALQLLLQKDADRITQIKDANKAGRDDQYKRGQRETAEKWESDIREAFGLSSDLTGSDLIAKAKETKIEGSGNGEITDDQVKSHPAYMALQNEKKKEIEDINKEWGQKLKDAESDYNGKVTRSTVNSRALSHIRSMNPVLPEDATKASKRLNLVTHELSNYQFKTDGDQILVIDEDGQQLTDAHNTPVSFEDLVKDIAETYFDFSAEEDGDKGGKNGTGNQNKFGSGKFSKTKVPTTPEELQQAMKDAKTPEERKELSEAFLKRSKEEN